MKAISGKDFCKVLEKNGWVLQRIRSSHHVYVHPTIPGQLSVPVHGNRDLKTGLLHRLLKDAELTEDDF